MHITSDIMLVRKPRIDYYGDHLIIVGFQRYNENHPWMVRRVSDKYTTGVFEGALSIN